MKYLKIKDTNDLTEAELFELRDEAFSVVGKVNGILFQRKVQHNIAAMSPADREALYRAIDEVNSKR